MKPFARAALSVLAAVLPLSAAHAEVLQKSERVDATTVSYELVLPQNFDSSKTYPAILGFSGGPQTLDTVERAVSSYYADQAEKRGYIVVVPAAPNGDLFFQGGERIFPAFLRQILAQYHIAGGKFHIMGQSNGGISAFYIASLYPQYFTSITALPGFLPNLSPASVAAISHLCIHMFVGQNDELGFNVPMQQNLTAFRAKGLSVSYSVEAGQPHRLESLAGAHAVRLFDQLEQDTQKGCGR